jgi:nicotinamidase-related amidase
MAQPTFVNEYTRAVPLNPTTTALVIVDMQNASGSRNHGLGKLLARQNRLDEAAYRFDRIDQLIVPNIKRLLATFRSVGAAIIYVTLGPKLADFSDAPNHLRAWFEATNNHAGNPEHDIVPGLKPQAGEPVFNKVTIGAFGSTAIDNYLRTHGIRELVVTGVSTNNCVGMTAMEAADRQYGVALVSDATGTCSDEMQQWTLTSFERLWGRVITTDAVMDEIGAARTLGRAAGG